MKKTAILTFDLNWIFAGGAKSGGASVVSKNLILELAKNPDIELTIICKGTPKTDIDGVKIINFTKYENLSDLYKKMEEHLQSENYDIVLTTNLEYLKHNPILQSQSFIHRCNNESFPANIIKKLFGKKKIQKQKSQFKNLPEGNKYISVSQSVKDDYVKNYNLNPQNIHACHLGCNQIYEHMPEITKNEYITFGCVANNSINKGGHLFILGLFALKLLGCKKFRAKIISKSLKNNSAVKSVLKLAGLSKNIEFIDPLDNIIEYYKTLDCLVLPSKNEAFGLVALETMSAGKPCVISSTTGVAEIIKHNENGLIFNRNSFFDFVKQLKTMYKIYFTDDYNKLAEKAFITSKKYTWKNFVDNILNCF